MRIGERQFDQLDIPTPPENVESVSRYAEAIQSVIGTDREVRLMYPERIGLDKHRYEYAFTRKLNDMEPDGFAKTVRLKENSIQAARMRRESDATAIANALEIPTPRLMHPYTETDRDLAVIHLEALDGRYGEALPGSRLTAGAPPEYGTWAAQLLANAAGTEIPSQLGPERIETSDERSANLEIFWTTWTKDLANTIDLPEQEQTILTPETAAELKTVFTALRAELEPVLKESEHPDRWFFVHNDASPGNMFFNRDRQAAQLIDLESSGATHNEALARIADWGNFYGRLWPNPEMQARFMAGLVDATDAKQNPDKALWIRGAMAFTTIFLAKFAMDLAHREHRMARALLQTLPERLKLLDSLLQQSQEDKK